MYIFIVVQWMTHENPVAIAPEMIRETQKPRISSGIG